MKSFRSILAFLLSLLLLCSTTGVAAVHHYCGGKLSRISVMSGQSCVCGGQHKKKKCCDQKVVLHKLQVELLKQHNDITPISPVVVAILTTAFLHFDIPDTGHRPVCRADLPLPDDIPIKFRSLLL